jgi:hypothetical protein
MQGAGSGGQERNVDGQVRMIELRGALIRADARYLFHQAHSPMPLSSAAAALYVYSIYAYYRKVNAGRASIVDRVVS